MRLLHTADWHLGQTLAGYSREAEHRAVLAALSELVAAREVDAVVIAGDVFDGQNPSGESQRLFYETLIAMREAVPHLKVVVTAGNHDAAGRLSAPGPLLAAFGVAVVGSVDRRDGRLEPARHLVPLYDRHGQLAAEVLAVSYPTAACLALTTTETRDGQSPIVAATRALYSELMAGIAPLRQCVPLIVTGHLHVAGGLESEGSERRILVGGQHAVPADVFPTEAAYVALGHLHRRQWVGRETIRYAGSLFPLSAGERAYRHGVTLVEIEPDGVRQIEEIDIPRPVPFLRIPTVGEARLGELGDHLAALALAADLPLAERPFVQFALAREGLPAGFRAEADRIAAGFPIRLVDVRLSPLPDADRPVEASDPALRLADHAPEDLFRQAFRRRHGRDPEPRHRDAFHHVASSSASTELAG